MRGLSAGAEVGEAGQEGSQTPSRHAVAPRVALSPAGCKDGAPTASFSLGLSVLPCRMGVHGRIPPEGRCAALGHTSLSASKPSTGSPRVWPRSPLLGLRHRWPLCLPGSGWGASSGGQPGGVMGRCPQRPGAGLSAALTPPPRPAGGPQPHSADTGMPRGSNGRAGHRSQAQARQQALRHTPGSFVYTPA